MWCLIWCMSLQVHGTFWHRKQFRKRVNSSYSAKKLQTVLKNCIGATFQRSLELLSTEWRNRTILETVFGVKSAILDARVIKSVICSTLNFTNLPPTYAGESKGCQVVQAPLPPHSLPKKGCFKKLNFQGKRWLGPIIRKFFQKNLEAPSTTEFWISHYPPTHTHKQSTPEFTANQPFQPKSFLIPSVTLAQLIPITINSNYKQRRDVGPGVSQLLVLPI